MMKTIIYFLLILTSKLKGDFFSEFEAKFGSEIERIDSSRTTVQKENLFTYTYRDSNDFKLIEKIFDISESSQQSDVRELTTDKSEIRGKLLQQTFFHVDGSRKIIKYHVRNLQNLELTIEDFIDSNGYLVMQIVHWPDGTYKKYCF